jgi:transposase InsO family protein
MGEAGDAADPLAALGRKTRADAGRRWAISDEVFSALKNQYHAHPRWTVQLHYDNLTALFEQRQPCVPMPSYKTVLRSMRERGWQRRREPAYPTDGQRRAAQRLQQREVRSYEASHVHGLWHADFHQARIRLLDESGQWLCPVALAILDDRSRLCCHLQFYLAETAECLVHGLTQAIMKRGLPRVFLTDNGAAMLAEETRQGLLRLGVEHKTTLPYSPYHYVALKNMWRPAPRVR